MTTRIATIIIAILTFIFQSCNQTKDLTDDEIFSIMNEIITDDSVQFSPTVRATFNKPTLDKEVKNILSPEDLKFIEKQISLFSDLHIKPDKLKRTDWRILVKRKISPYVNIIPNQSDSIHHSYFSLPIISSDRQKVIITIGSAGCFMCGGHGTYLYEKVNGKWRQTKSWDVIIV